MKLELGNKHTNIQSIDLEQKHQYNSMGKENSPQVMILEELDVCKGKGRHLNSYLTLYTELVWITA